MQVDITTVALGFCQCYLVRGKAAVAVDAGAPGKGQKLVQALHSAGIRPEDLQLVILTHGHWDHIGSAAEIRAATGARIVMHRSEVAWLEKSLKPLSPGVTFWGKVLRAMHRPFMPLIKVPAAKVDLVLDDTPVPLSDHGIAGTIFHTPGHSPGSISLLLESGEAFVGDLAMNSLPLRLSPGLPIFADDPAAVIRSWELLLGNGAEVIYPAHGKPFPASLMRQALARRC